MYDRIAGTIWEVSMVTVSKGRINHKTIKIHKRLTSKRKAERYIESVTDKSFKINHNDNTFISYYSETKGFHFWYEARRESIF